MNIILKWDSSRVTIEQFANMCRSYAGLMPQYQIVYHLIDMVATMAFDTDINDYVDKDVAIKVLTKFSYYDFSLLAKELNKQQEENGLLLMAQNLFGNNVKFSETKKHNKI